MICLFTDLSEVMELEEQLRLKDSLARLGEMTAGIAHEFRNGLATIHGYSRLLDLERLRAERIARTCRAFATRPKRSGQVVTNFLVFARPTELTLAPVEMSTLVERAGGRGAGATRARAAATSMVRGEFGRVDGDEVLLRQALSNLCRNAFEACDNASVAPQIVIEGQRDAVARRRCGSASATTVPASRRLSRRESSARSSPPRRRAPASASRSSRRSSSRTTAA